MLVLGCHLVTHENKRIKGSDIRMLAVNQGDDLWIREKSLFFHCLATIYIKKYSASISKL